MNEFFAKLQFYTGFLQKNIIKDECFEICFGRRVTKFMKFFYFSILKTKYTFMKYSILSMMLLFSVISISKAQNSYLVRGNNEFAFKFYKQIADSSDNNLFFSPYSISFALAMTYEGAEGETAKEMREVMNFPE